jgi:hypothetical protein
MTPSPLAQRIRATIRRSPVAWAAACHVTLRPYQRQIALAIKDSIIHQRGLAFVVILPRQSGKNELQSHLFSWLLFRYARAGGRIVSVSPTFKPQTTNNMDRVKVSLDACIGSRGLWKSSKGYLYSLGNARLQFFSGEPRARVVGATADLLLSVDEAQSISPAKFDKDFDPMTASTNATRVFWGTAWTADTLLERERKAALQAQGRDGIQRLFYFTADDVRCLVPSYGRHVDRKIAELGRNHPLIRTQFFSESIDAQSSMFNPARLALIRTDLSPASGPLPGSGTYAFLIDVAGQDESRMDPLAFSNSGLANPARDSTVLSIVEIDLSTLKTLDRPSYHVVTRHSWIGENHLSVFGKLKRLAETWNPKHIVMDATGVGEGLWALVDRAFPRRVIPVKFTQQEKSDIGWRFLSIIETGRFCDHAHTDEVRLQYAHCIYEILPGPAKTLRWGVPEGARGPDGGLIHDDFILADSLTAVLDRLDWYLTFGTTIINPPDWLKEIQRRDYNHRLDCTRGSLTY